MKKAICMAATFAAFANAGHAGGIERSSQPMGILFEEGRYMELTFSSVSPSVSGNYTAPPGSQLIPPGTVRYSRDVTDSFTNLSLGYRQPLSDNLDIAFILDQPVGVNVTYLASYAGYPLQGAEAKVDSLALTGLLRYRLTSGFSIYGGLRAQSIDGSVSSLRTAIPNAGIFSYTMTTDKNDKLGYVAGMAYEKADIALRVALTYNSKITHTLAGKESFQTIPGLPGSLEALANRTPNISESFETEIPQSVNLEFQTGIAPNTLLFGSVRWQEWSEFDVAPKEYLAFRGAPLADFDDDTITYNLGIGRRFNDSWSGAITLGYEPGTGKVKSDDCLVSRCGSISNLGPTDGFKSIGVAVTYTAGNTKITGGVLYVDICDALPETIVSNFTGNKAVSVGLRFGYSF